MNSSLYRHVALLVVLLVLFSLISFTATKRETWNDDPAQTLGEPIADLPVPAPAPITKTMQAVLDKSTGFSAFISYTNEGFEPPSVNISKGQAVRFTNNSTDTLWISAVAKNGRIYPGSQSACGQSDFDTCISMAPNEIWEFTFKESGTWAYRNNVEQSHVGTVRVQ